MVLLDNDSYLNNSSKLCQKIKNKGTIRFTIKRDRFFDEKPSIKKGFAKALCAKRINELEKDPNLMSKLVYKVKQNESSFSTKVEENKIINFTSSLLNIFRLNFLKAEVKKVEKKKIMKKKPTQRKEKSKNSLKKIEKNRRNQERRKKRKELKKSMKKQKQKQASNKISDKHTMEIEKN